MKHRKEKLEFELQLRATRKRLLTELKDLQPIADFFDGPSAIPASLPRKRREHIAEAFQQVLRLGKTRVPTKVNRLQWARQLIVVWLRSLPNSREILPQLLPLLEAEMTDEILRDRPEIRRSNPPQKRVRHAQSKKTDGNSAQQRPRKYRSKLKRAIRTVLTDDPEALNERICTKVDEEGLDERALPRSLRKAGLRSLTDAFHRDSRLRHNLICTFNKVRGDLGIKSRSEDS